MDVRLDGKVAFVTGASTGIGAAIAKLFGSSGAQLALHFNSSKAEAERVAADIEAAGGPKPFLVQGDFLDTRSVDGMVDTVLDRFGSIDILVNNAGAMLDRSPVDAMPERVYLDVMELNLGSVFRVSKRVIPCMKKQKSGVIINLSSIAAFTGGAPGAAIYAASKAAVVALTKGLAKELAPFNIRVNAISPGVIATPFHDKATPPEVFKALASAIPLGRVGTAEELAATALFLASEQLSSFITGEVVQVNGGALMA